MRQQWVNRRDQSIVSLVHTVAALDMLPNFKRLFVDQLVRTNRFSIDQLLLRNGASRHLTRHNVTSIHGCIMNRIRHNAPYIRLGCASGRMRFSPPLNLPLERRTATDVANTQVGDQVLGLVHKELCRWFLLLSELLAVRCAISVSLLVLPPLFERSALPWASMIAAPSSVRVVHFCASLRIPSIFLSPEIDVGWTINTTPTEDWSIDDCILVNSKSRGP